MKVKRIAKSAGLKLKKKLPMVSTKSTKAKPAVSKKPQKKSSKTMRKQPEPESESDVDSLGASVDEEEAETSDEEMALLDGEAPLNNADSGSSEDVDDDDMMGEGGDSDAEMAALLDEEEDGDDEEEEESDPEAYDDEGEDEEEEDGNEEGEDDAMKGSKHKASLQKLKETDPEFFKFMQSEDPDLLEFHESDAEEDEEGEEKEGEEGEGDEEGAIKKKRIPKAHRDSTGRFVFDGNMFDYLQDLLDPEDEVRRKPTLEDVKFAVEAFQSCVARVGADIEAPAYVINEQTVFDEVTRLCFQYIPEMFRGLSGKGKEPKDEMEVEEGEEDVKPVVAKKSKGKKLAKKYHPFLKQFLTGVLHFLNEIQTPGAIISTLKATFRFIDLFSEFHKLIRVLCKGIIRIWTRKTMDCRIMAYICMNQLIKQYPDQFAYMYKACYLGFVSNSRDVSIETWPLLQFMHRTFAELTILHPDVAYPYAFVYIRQTAIHLRNAMISKKRKDLVQTIYNWQLIQCLYLWARVVSKAHSVNGAEAICELAYPLTQIIIGVFRLYPSPRFLPLRFHCVSILIQLQATCVIYIPTLSLACDLLAEMEQILRKKPKVSKLPSKAPHLDSHLKVNTDQMEDPVWRNTANDYLFRIILQAAHNMCNQAAFPDLVVPIVHRLRSYVKSVRSADHARLYRGLIEKMESHSRAAVDLLRLRDMNLSDEISVRATQFAMNNPDAPLRAYYRQWEKVWKMKQDALIKEHLSVGSDQKKTDKKEEKTKKTPAQPGPKAKKPALDKDEEDSDAEYVEEETQKLASQQATVNKKKDKKKFKRKIAPAASRADATLPDEVADLGRWSDDE